MGKHFGQDWRRWKEKWKGGMRKIEWNIKPVLYLFPTGLWVIRTVPCKVMLIWESILSPNILKMKPLSPPPISFPAQLTPPIICEQHCTVHVLAAEVSQGVCHCHVLIVCIQHPDFVPSLAHRRWNEMICRKIQVAFITKSMLPL